MNSSGITSDALPLAALVGEAEQAAFHAGPAEALARIAAAEARAAGAVDELGVLAWLRGVALTAQGEVTGALDVLGGVLSRQADDARARLVVAWAAGTSSSLHRQLGAFDVAEALDRHGYAAAEPLGLPAIEARLDCEVGLVSDAAGRGDLAAALTALDSVTATVDAVGEAARWRPRIRLDWARAEVASLQRDPAAAEAAALAALAAAEVNEAPRHECRSLLYAGIAALESGQPAVALERLRRCVEIARTLGLRLLFWRPAGILAALTAGTDPEGSAALLAEARAAVAYVAGVTPSPLRETWLARPDVAALMPS